jgi:pyrroloquinoline-quinone synthase
MMELQSFVTTLDGRIAQYDLLCHPYYKAWTAGELTREDLREYASNYYCHVAAFPACLSALHSRLDDGKVRRSVLSNLCEEDLGARPHSELWLDFAQGMGADRDEVRRREPAPEVYDLVRAFQRVAREGSTAEALAVFYVYESQVPRVAKAKADGLAQRYGADQKTCRYFTLHQFADVKHSQVWRELLAIEIAAHPDEAESALAAAETAARALWSVLDGMEARRKAAA